MEGETICCRECKKREILTKQSFLCSVVWFVCMESVEDRVSFVKSLGIVESKAKEIAGKAAQFESLRGVAREAGVEGGCDKSIGTLLQELALQWPKVKKNFSFASLLTLLTHFFRRALWTVVQWWHVVSPLVTWTAVSVCRLPCA